MSGHIKIIIGKKNEEKQKIKSPVYFHWSKFPTNEKRKHLLLCVFASLALDKQHLLCKRMSSSIYEIFHYIPPTFNQCPSTISNSNLSNTSSFFLPLQQPFIPCQLHNITDNYTNHVQLVDSNYLMRAPTHFDCYILLFFARWCQFSVRFAPYFNAIPRAFPGLDFVAYDVSKSLR